MFFTPDAARDSSHQHRLVTYTVYHRSHLIVQSTIVIIQSADRNRFDNYDARVSPVRCLRHPTGQSLVIRSQPRYHSQTSSH
ncbi:hypothetical protein BaRGS_00027391 [Batillaria attramentaria]|uniref:Uncharacterized protein n=1 Tax=Batillaria attramentaria TaxID=370345 RepID=A0ABD0K1Y7_9CAEN